ncbi:MAG: LysE family translocator [Kutzneria sp.]|nr:LysE family translocator [Kutzneria sp.]
MESSAVLGFVVACVVLNLVPGPGMMFILAHGIVGGRRAGVAAATGMAAGTVVHTVTAAVGLSALLAAMPTALNVVRIGGTVVLLYLAIHNLRSARQTVSPIAGHSLRRTFVSAVLTNLANPKVVVFYLAFVPQFITAGGWSTSVQILVLGAVLIAIGLVMDTTVGVAAGAFSALLLSRPAIQGWIKRAAAAVFGGLALRLLLTESH